MMPELVTAFGESDRLSEETYTKARRVLARLATEAGASAEDLRTTLLAIGDPRLDSLQEPVFRRVTGFSAEEARQAAAWRVEATNGYS